MIPTPDASGLADIPEAKFEKYYTPDFHLPKSFIKFSSMVEEVIGCLYNMNERDKEWLDSLPEDQRSAISDDEFEKAIFLLDQAGNDKVSGECPELEACISFIEKAETQDKPELGPELIALIYEYWKKVRYEKQTGKALLPILKVTF